MPILKQNVEMVAADCTPSFRAQCEEIERGGIAASIFGTSNPQALNLRLRACVGSCSVVSPRMNMLIEGAAKLADIDRMAKEKTQK